MARSDGFASTHRGPELQAAFEAWARHVARHPEGTLPNHPVRLAIWAAAEAQLAARPQAAPRELVSVTP